MIPYPECDDAVAMSNIRAGITPVRPPGGISDVVWQLLEECWRTNPWERPSTAKMYKTFSKFRSVHKAVGELPRRLKLWVQSVKLSLKEPKKQRVYVKFKYGSNVHITPLTSKVVVGDAYTWFAFHSFPSSLSSLSLGQERYRNLRDRNSQALFRAHDLPRSLPRILVWVRQGLRDREFLRKPTTTP